MPIPFIDLFKKAKARLSKQAAPPRDIIAQRLPALEKKDSERLSKTVLPNATRTVASVDPFQVAAGSAKGRSREMPTPLTPEVEPGDRSITLKLADFLQNFPAGSVKSADAFDSNRSIKIKTAEIEKGMASGQPSVLLSSIYEQAPEIFKQSVNPNDLTTVTLPHEKVLEQIQTLQVRVDQFQDEAVPQVETPFLQVTIEDTKKFGTSLSPIQTSAKPPVKVEPASAKSIARAEPEAVAQEKHSPNVSSRRPISITPPPSIPIPAPKPAPVPAPASGPTSTPAPTRIPFKLPPNGAGGPASERVPASSGPPVPTPSPAPPASSPPSAVKPIAGPAEPAKPSAAPAKSTAPARIPFKMTPGLKPKLTLVPGVEPPAPEPSTTKTGGPASSSPPAVAAPAAASQKKSEVVRLRLNICLRNVPAFQLSGSVPEIGDDVTMELPYSLVEPQLASGRIAIDPKVFQQAIPEAHRSLFVIDSTETPVLLPLQEVLQHLPTSALQMRDDQEKEEVINYFETPFSRHADEDQKLFGKASEAGAKKAEPAKPKDVEASSAPAESLKAESAPPVKTDAKPASPAPAEAEKKVSAEQKATEPVVAKPEDKKMPEVKESASATPATADAKTGDAAAAEAVSNAKEFMLRASCLPGISACSISFADGLSMAGNFPPGIGADGLLAMAPSVLQKMEKHMLESSLGELTAMTLYCRKHPLTFFMRGNVCLTVLHPDPQLETVTRDQLSEMTKELAKIFSQPE